LSRFIANLPPAKFKPEKVWFDKNFLLDGMRINNEKEEVKGENRAKSMRTKGVFLRKRDVAGLDFTNRR